MSQSTLTSFFQVRKRLPEQQAAKRRKIVLEKHQIQDILENEDAGDNDDAGSSDEEFEDCPVIGEEKKDESPSDSEKDDEFKDCVDQEQKQITEEETQSENIKETKRDEVFVDDEDWEELAVKALDSAAAASTDSKETKIIPPGSEITSSVVTSALGNNSVIQRHGTEEPGTGGTPSQGKKGVNFRKSKKDEKEGKWTPKKVSEPLFTIGYREPVVSAKKRLNMSEKSKNVVFQKLSSLSPRKKVQENYSSPKNINSEKLGLRLTPKKYAGSPLKKPSGPGGVSKNLFSDSPEKCVKPDLGRAIEQALSLQTKVTPAEVKAKLGKVKLADLKSRLASLSSSSLKVAEVKAAATTCKPPKLSPSITLELDLPPSPSKRVPPSPHKSPYKASPRKVPAYQRFHNLARPADRTLPLPYSYRMLAEVFRCMDTVVSMFNNRKEIINLDKLSKSVTDLLQKKWNIKYLQQILCVFPQAYKVSWERAEMRMGMIKKELQIRPNMSYKRDLLEELDGRMESYVRMLPEQMVERRDIFRNSLLEMVKDHHEEFLASLDPPIEADRKALTSWHKDFIVDAAPEVDIAELPVEPGKVSAETVAKEMLGKAADLVHINPKLSDVLRNVPVKAEENKYSENFKSPSKMPAGLEGLNAALIEKIKAKEAARAVLEMTRNPEQIKRIAQLKKLPELARMIRNLFISEKKAALEVQFSCKKLVESLPHGTEKAKIEENLRLLTVESRGWLSLHLVGCAEYFKMDKTDINQVCRRLEQKLKDEQGI